MMVNKYPIRMIVAGSRSFKDESLFKTVLDEVLNGLEKNDVELVSGMATQGPDNMVVGYAKSHGFTLMEYPAKWDIYGKSAGMIRNADMGTHATHLLAFYDGKSKGTANMLEVAQKNNLNTKVVYFDSELQEHLPYIPAFSATLIKDNKPISGVNIFRDEARMFSDLLGFETLPSNENVIKREVVENSIKKFRIADPFTYVSTKSKSFLDFLNFIENPSVSVSSIRLPIAISEPLTQMSKKI